MEVRIQALSMIERQSLKSLELFFFADQSDVTKNVIQALWKAYQHHSLLNYLTIEFTKWIAHTYKTTLRKGTKQLYSKNSHIVSSIQ